MKRVALAILLCVVAVGAVAEDAVIVPLPPAILKDCNANGGCILIARRHLAAEIDAIVREEVVKALFEASQKGCRRSDV